MKRQFELINKNNGWNIKFISKIHIKENYLNSELHGIDARKRLKPLRLGNSKKKESQHVNSAGF